MAQKLLDQVLVILKAIWLKVAAFFAPDNLLKNVIKAAAVGLTLPATIIVAGELYTDPLYSLMAQIAGAVLIEGTLLLGWYKLDTSEKASMEQRRLYALLAVVAYFVLWIIALVHGEGLVGIAFRSTLGAALYYSVRESGLLAELRLQRAADRNIASHRKVKRYRERAEIRVARLEIDRWERDEVQVIMPGYKRRNLFTLLESLATPKAQAPKQLPAPSARPPFRLDDTNLQLIELWSADPHLSNAKAGEAVKLSGERVRQRLLELQAAGVVHKNGNGVEILVR